MNYMFSDKYDMREELDKKVGADISDEIFDVITKEEEEYKKEKKSLEDYCKYAEQMEESAGKLSTCLDNIEVSLRNIESILLSASTDKKNLEKTIQGSHGRDGMH